jgi:hypothetical protein
MQQMNIKTGKLREVKYSWLIRDQSDDRSEPTHESSDSESEVHDVSCASDEESARSRSRSRSRSMYTRPTPKAMPTKPTPKAKVPPRVPSQDLARRAAGTINRPAGINRSIPTGKDLPAERFNLPRAGAWRQEYSDYFDAKIWVLPYATGRVKQPENERDLAHLIMLLDALKRGCQRPVPIGRAAADVGYMCAESLATVDHIDLAQPWASVFRTRGTLMQIIAYDGSVGMTAKHVLVCQDRKSPMLLQLQHYNKVTYVVGRTMNDPGSAVPSSATNR